MFLQGNTFAPEKHVPTGRAVGEGISIQKENEGVKREICRWQVLKRQPGCTAWHSPASGIAVPMSRMQSSQLSLPPFVGNMQISRTDFSALLLNYGQAAVSSGCGSASGCASAVTCVSSVSAASVCFSCCSFTNSTALRSSIRLWRFSYTSLYSLSIPASVSGMCLRANRARGWRQRYYRMRL